MTAISKNVYFDVLHYVADEYNSAYHKIIKMKPINVKKDSFTEYNEKSNEKDVRFKVGDHVRISKYTNTFAKGYASTWNEEIFAIRQIKNTVLI